MKLGANVNELIFAMRAPNWTPEFTALHERLYQAQHEGTLTDALLNECTDPECLVCGLIVCPYQEPLHFHHDGCPACATVTLPRLAKHGDICFGYWEVGRGYQRCRLCGLTIT